MVEAKAYHFESRVRVVIRRETSLVLVRGMLWSISLCLSPMQRSQLKIGLEANDSPRCCSKNNRCNPTNELKRGGQENNGTKAQLSTGPSGAGPGPPQYPDSFNGPRPPRPFVPLAILRCTLHDGANAYRCGVVSCGRQ